MIEYHTAIILVAIALIIGAVGGAIFYRYGIREGVSFAAKLPDGKWHKFTVIREYNLYKILADGDIILSEKHGDQICRR